MIDRSRGRPQGPALHKPVRVGLVTVARGAIALKTPLTGTRGTYRDPWYLARYNRITRIVAVNDVADAGTLARLLAYDSIYGRFPGDVRADDWRSAGGRPAHPHIHRE